MSCGVGRRRGSDPALLWLWRRPVATAPIRHLAWEPPYAAGAAQEIATTTTTTKKKKKKRRKKKGHRTDGSENTAVPPNLRERVNNSVKTAKPTNRTLQKRRPRGQQTRGHTQQGPGSCPLQPP